MNRLARRLLTIAALVVQIAGACAQDPPPPSAALTEQALFPFSASVQLLDGKMEPEVAEKTKVIGGREAAAGQFKWQVAIIQASAPTDDPAAGFFCGASLIGWRWVLTAAHCTFENSGSDNRRVPIEAQKVHVYLGAHNFENGERIAVRRIIRHPNYDIESHAADLALFELDAEPQNRDQLALITLMPESAMSGAKPRATVLGWGSKEQGMVASDQRRSQRVLRYAEGLQFKEQSVCNKQYLGDFRARYMRTLLRSGYPQAQVQQAADRYYPANKQIISDSMICVGTASGRKDACFGDSGGPLIVRLGGEKQIGIVSWGPSDGCGLPNLFGVYVLVPYYLPWLREQTGLPL